MVHFYVKIAPTDLFQYTYEYMYSLGSYAHYF